MIRVLVAEDDLITSRLYQMHFKRNGIDGSFYTTGKDALVFARESPPAVAVLDFELPDERGIEVMKKLHQIPGCAGIPVIFVTGRATQGLEKELIEAGAVAVLGKPFSPLRLIDLIHQLSSGQTP
jgi:CheY-like chemotaxis protein